jgi:hypothetical protein
MNLKRTRNVHRVIRKQVEIEYLSFIKNHYMKYFFISIASFRFIRSIRFSTNIRKNITGNYAIINYINNIS